MINLRSYFKKIALPFLICQIIFKYGFCDEKKTTKNAINVDITNKAEKSTQEVTTSENRLLPMVINTWAFKRANARAWSVLNRSNGGINQTLNAVVEGCTMCEFLQCDGTVGFGGSPDEFGETTLDAMIMDGANMRIGAVAGLRRIKDAIRVAKTVMQHTRHTLLVGDAATNFAIAMGFNEESLATSESYAIWSKWLANNCQPNFWLDVHPNPTLTCGPYKPSSTPSTPWKEERSRYEYNIGADNHDTIGMIAIDIEGHIYAGTSTNGARYKIPGRVGDSPIPGAGAYADNKVGAAVATGDGDIMMRFLPSLIAVEAMRNGKQPEEAAKVAMQRIESYYQDFSGALVVVDRFGNYAAACVGMDEFPYTITNRKTKHVPSVEYKKCLN